MHDAHSSELVAQLRVLRSEKQNARRVTWVEQRSTTFNGNIGLKFKQ
jgi:hypothetical protein